MKVISIHAPAWGATMHGGGHDGGHQFQSTHPRGVRLMYYTQRMEGLNFNPRTRVGCDKFTRRSTRIDLYFNPRTRVGCDTITILIFM